MAKKKPGDVLYYHLFRAKLRRLQLFLSNRSSIVIHLLKAELLPSVIDQKDARYYPYHWIKRHTSGQCFTFNRIFEKHRASEILFREGAVNINDLRLPKCSDKGKGQCDDGISSKMEIERDEQKAPEGKMRSGLNGSTVRNLFKLNNFCSNGSQHRPGPSNHKGNWAHRVFWRLKSFSEYPT